MAQIMMRQLMDFEFFAGVRQGFFTFANQTNWRIGGVARWFQASE
jgi:hypothetical protein